MSHQPTWGSRFAFIMVATGAAVGLGNIWKFPYMAGDNGGSAFVLLYLMCVLAVGIPTLIAEIGLGKLAQKNPVRAFKIIQKARFIRFPWHWIGVLGLITLLIVLSFYSVVAGWSLSYLGYALKNQFWQASPIDVQNIWAHLLASPGLLLFNHTVFMLLTLGVVALGVKSGIERSVKIMMPILFLILIMLVIHAYLYFDFKAGWNFLFKINVSAITPKVFLDALGHAFFTLAIGAGTMLVYGVYLPKNQPFVGTILIITVLDIAVAFLAGLAIFPLVFGYGLTPQAGPGLMYQTLPLIFSQLSYGSLLGAAFFILLLFAAWTSSVSMAEPLVLYLSEEWGLSRTLCAGITGFVAWLLGLLSVFSFNIWQNVRLFGDWGIFDFLTDGVTNFLLPIGGLGITLFAGWIVPKQKLQEAVMLNGLYFAVFRVVLKYITPIGILLILCDGLLV